MVVPAHDEAVLIQRCLAFVQDLEPGEAEVVVVANGCSDATARRAAEVPGVAVLDLPQAGKVGALNAGDAAVTTFPRVYVDADVVVSADALRRVARALSGERPAVAAPSAVFVTEGRSLPVRLFYRAFLQLPYAAEQMVGMGVYALNRAGRARFGAFPETMADDLLVQRCFSSDETRVLPDCTFEVQTPRDLRSLLAVRTRGDLRQRASRCHCWRHRAAQHVGHRAPPGPPRAAPPAGTARRPRLRGRDARGPARRSASLGGPLAARRFNPTARSGGRWTRAR